MDPRQVPHDDLLDVSEIMDDLDKKISDTLEGHNKEIAVSALISSSINNLTSQCKSLRELIFYRNLMVKVLDDAIDQIKIWRKAK